MRFDPVRDEKGNARDGRLYAGSFNVDPAYRGSAIGEAMLVNVLEKEANNSVIEATVSPDIVVGSDYVEKRGFVISKTLPNYDNSGETFFEIILDKEANARFATKTEELTKQQIMSMYETMHANAPLDELIERSIVIQRFDSTSEKDDMLATTERLTGKGYVGTRYFVDPQDRKRRYYVFEKVEQEQVKDAA